MVRALIATAGMAKGIKCFKLGTFELARANA